MLCPICNKLLVQHQKGLFVCADGHGTLVTGKYLSDIEEAHTVLTNPKNSSPGDTKHEIVCPNCSNTMHKVDYNSTDIIIDSCVNCHYRWLDKGEFGKIKDHKPKLDPIDKALLMSVEENIGKAPQDNDLNTSFHINPRTSFSSPAALGITAARAVLTGLRHSWLTRIATVATLIIAALVYDYVIKEFNK